MNPNKLHILFPALAAIIVIFPGCATMDKEECTTANWQDIGYEDGAKGYKVSRITAHRKACAEYGVSPDLDAYKKGRIQGLIEYCTPENGFALGRQGQPYVNICGSEQEEHFRHGYNAGLDVYRLGQKIEEEKKNLDRMIKKINSVESQIEKKEAGLSQACLNKAQCRTALNTIRELDRKNALLHAKAKMTKNSIKAMERTLADMKVYPGYQ